MVASSPPQALGAKRTAGATIGDSLGYLIGRVGGTALIGKLRGRFFMSERRYDRAQRLVLSHGYWAVFVARFITGLRMLAGPFAGAFLMPYPRFLMSVGVSSNRTAVVGRTG